MNPHQALYAKLFYTTAKAIEVLQEIQKEAQELYIAAGEESAALVCKEGPASPKEK